MNNPETAVEAHSCGSAFLSSFTVKMPGMAFLTAHVCAHSLGTNGVPVFDAVTRVFNYSPVLSLRMSNTCYNCECADHK